MLNLLQVIFTGIIALFAILAAFWASQIGVTQNSISETSLKINNFVEVFLMPQVITDSSGKVVAWKILVKNVSAYPVYLNSYALNGVKTDIGSTPIPNNSDSWYGVPISQDIQGKGQFSIIIDFEDYLGNKYESEGFGSFENGGWNIHQNKRTEIQNNTNEN